MPRPPADRRLASRFGAEVADQWPLALAVGRATTTSTSTSSSPRPEAGTGDAAAVSPYGWAATWSRPIRPLDAGGPPARLPRVRLSLSALGACTCDCERGLCLSLSTRHVFTWAGQESPLRCLNLN